MRARRRRGGIVLVTAATVALLASQGSAVGAAAAAPAHHRPPHNPAIQEFFWSWSDNQPFDTRTFVQTNYPDPARLPHLVFRVVPAVPRQMVYLQFQQDGEWVTENIARTDRTGIARITVDPFCENSTWCDGVYRYRLSIDGVTAPLTISYFEH